MSHAATMTKQPTVIGAGWERFWFTPADPLPLCCLRIALGAVALYYALSFTADLERWFGTGGILKPATLAQLIPAGRQVTDPELQRPMFHPSLFNLANSNSVLWTVHWALVAAIVLFTVGLFTRVTSVLALVAVLSYYHQAPMLAGQLDAPLAIMLFYLCLGPAGAYLSLDRVLFKRAAPAPTVAANISLRLMQLHLAALYFVIAVTQLGSSAWWGGLGAWWLIARTESRMVDLTTLARYVYLVNLWSYAVVTIEFAFAFLAWRNWARKTVLLAATLMWLSLIPITGLASWCLFMAVMSLAFVPAETLRRVTQRG